MIRSYFKYLLSLAVVAVLGYVGCNYLNLGDIANSANSGTAPENPANTTTAVSAPPAELTDKITIAAFNIQVFGKSKSEDSTVMNYLAQIVRKFDVVAVQEIRTVDQNHIPSFIELLNQDGSNYDYLIGPRQGRSISKEQYVFVYDTAKISVMDAGFVVPDEEDEVHRPPVVSRFAVRATPGRTPFTFSLMNIHTDPDEVAQEVDALAKMYKFVQDALPEDDVILLGDLNADEKKFGKLAEVPNIGWVISNVPTNTAGNKTYDNILFDVTKTSEFTGEAGVFDFKTEFNLTKSQAIEISDHFPVWAVFSSEEKPAVQVAANPN